jgi:hypothetical protein
VWNLVGLFASLAIAAAAWRRSVAAGGFYDAGVYAMTPVIHRRYAGISLAFAVFFAAAAFFRWETAGVAALALYAVIAVFYVSSFVRGASDDDR